MKRALKYLLILTLAFCGCDPEAGLEFPDYEPKLVIDGYIEQGEYAYVALTKSAGFFEDIDEDDLKRASVVTAKVTVSDGENEEVLTLKKNKHGFPPLAYYGTEIRGEIGKSYTLTVVNEGRTYTAVTTIPPAPQFDSLWFEPYEGSEQNFLLKATFTDNVNETNYYRVFTQVKNVDSQPVPMYLSAIGDRYFNGKTFSIDILRGAENFSSIGADIYFEKNDTVRVRFCSLDQPHFDFWRTLEREVYATGNPFSSSGNEILHNTSEGSIGIWGGYGASYRIVVAR